MEHHDFMIVGGGLVGGAIAYGLAKLGHEVAIVDEGDIAYRAARGNFGLVWVQSKGFGMPCYSDWTRSSARLWHDFAPEIRELTGIDVQYQGRGGVHICGTEAELQARHTRLEQLSQDTEGRFQFKMLDHGDLADLIPIIGAHVAGGSWCEMDGHANPLLLLHALHRAVQLYGGAYIPDFSVERIVADGGGYRLEGQGQVLHGTRVVLAAGLGNRTLAAHVGLDAPLTANRGQVMVTERVAPLLDIPTPFVRQTGEGTIQLGDSHEDVGMDDGTLSDVLSEIAQRALNDFPILRDVRAVRGWGCLRIMTPDGCPIYEQSNSHPGVFMACCHSGVTLAAAHAKRLSGWIAGGELPPETKPLNLERFHVQTPVIA